MFWVLTFLLSVAAQAFGGFVLKSLWGWFIVPLGAAPIGTVHAVGLVTTVSLFVGVYFTAVKSAEMAEKSYWSENRKAAVRAASQALVAALVLLSGWVWSRFM